MPFRAKITALFVLLLLVAAPLAALGTCVPEKAAKAHCPDDCPMMKAAGSPGLKLKAVNPDGSCCQISSGKPRQDSPAQLSSAASSKVVASQTVNTTILIVAAAPRASQSDAPAPPCTGTGHQAVLCTFLI